MLRNNPTKTNITVKALSHNGQTAVEYLILLGVVVAIVLVGFKTHIPRTQRAGEMYFNRIGKGLMGKTNPCGDGFCDAFESQYGGGVAGSHGCPADCF